MSGSECRRAREEERGKDGAGDEGSAKDRHLLDTQRLLLSQGRGMHLPSQEPPCSRAQRCPCPPQGRVTSQVGRST